MAAMLVYLDKSILNIFFWKYTNMAANFFVVLIPRDWVKTLYISMNGHDVSKGDFACTLICMRLKRPDIICCNKIWCFSY